MRSQIAKARKSEKARARRKDFEKRRNIHANLPVVSMVKGKLHRKPLSVITPKSKKVTGPINK